MHTLFNILLNKVLNRDILCLEVCGYKHWNGNGINGIQKIDRRIKRRNDFFGFHVK